MQAAVGAAAGHAARSRGPAGVPAGQGGLPVALGMVDPDNGWAAIAADSGCHVAKFSKTPPTPA